MRKLSVFFLSALAVLVCSCGKTPVEENAEAASGLYVLNNGSWGGNNSNIGIYDPVAKVFTADVFSSVNGKALGDLAQDILVDGDDVYICVNGSQVVFVTDRELRIKKEIVARTGGQKLSPRYLAKGSRGIYVSYYEGYIGLIEEGEAESSVRLTSVGPNPEGIVCCAGKLYVAASGGYLYPVYNNTLSVVDEESFEESGSITVSTNPVKLKSWGTRLYLLCYGDYDSVAPGIQCIDTCSGSVSPLDCAYPSDIALYDGMLYVLCGGYDEKWNPLPGSVRVYDAESGSMVEEFRQRVPGAYSISATEGYVWVGASDYKTNGDVYVFTTDGTLYDKFDCQGLNPLTVTGQANYCHRTGELLPQNR